MRHDSSDGVLSPANSWTILWANHLYMYSISESHGLAWRGGGGDETYGNDGGVLPM
jgi:hypothetical protein